MKCFYHKSDLDGHCSGAIVKYRYPECEMIGVDYNDTLESLNVTIPEREEIYVVDFRFSMEDMNTINHKAILHWIDHHKTSIEEAEKENFIPTGGKYLKIGKGACELTWQYLFGSQSSIPTGVKLLSLHDVWDHSTDSRTEAFQYGMRQCKNTLPENQELWVKVFDPWENYFLTKTVEVGQIILEYRKNSNEIYAKGMSFETKFEGYRAIVMNKPYDNSSCLESVYDPEKHDIQILFGVKPGEYKYTLFCDKPDIDVSAIAKKYGGGGHRGAAGFYSEELLFK